MLKISLISPMAKWIHQWAASEIPIKKGQTKIKLPQECRGMTPS